MKTKEELKIMGKETFLDYFIDGLISYNRGFLRESEFMVINRIFKEKFNSREIREMFRVYENYPTMDERFDEFMKPKMELIDKTNRGKETT